MTAEEPQDSQILDAVSLFTQGQFIQALEQCKPQLETSNDQIILLYLKCSSCLSFSEYISHWNEIKASASFVVWKEHFGNLWNVFGERELVLSAIETNKSLHISEFMQLYAEESIKMHRPISEKMRALIAVLLPDLNLPEISPNNPLIINSDNSIISNNSDNGNDNENEVMNHQSKLITLINTVIRAIEVRFRRLLNNFIFAHRRLAYWIEWIKSFDSLLSVILIMAAVYLLKKRIKL